MRVVAARCPHRRLGIGMIGDVGAEPLRMAPTRLGSEIVGHDQDIVHLLDPADRFDIAERIAVGVLSATTAGGCNSAAPCAATSKFLRPLPWQSGSEPRLHYCSVPGR